VLFLKKRIGGTHRQRKTDMFAKKAKREDTEERGDRRSMMLETGIKEEMGRRHPQGSP